MVEQEAVNFKVAGSSPARGARWDAEATKRPFLLNCRDFLDVRKFLGDGYFQDFGHSQLDASILFNNLF